MSNYINTYVNINPFTLMFESVYIKEERQFFTFKFIADIVNNK